MILKGLLPMTSRFSRGRKKGVEVNHLFQVSLAIFDPYLTPSRHESFFQDPAKKKRC